jgi:hypothetical protein
MVYLRVDLNAEQRLGAALDESSQLALLIGVHGPHSHLQHFWIKTETRWNLVRQKYGRKEEK